MTSGMLWFDNNKKTPLSAKIAVAVEYYRRKYGEPTLCLCNPAALDGTQTDAEIAVRGYRPVLPGHLWIGVDEDPKG